MDVIIGIIKVNVFFWMVFVVLSGIDLCIIIDINGVEKLLGWGDMFFLLMGENKLICI